VASRGEGGGGTATTTRPKSPDEPPRIQHWHKLRSSDTFEASALSRAWAGGQRLLEPESNVERVVHPDHDHILHLC